MCQSYLKIQVKIQLVFAIGFRTFSISGVGVLRKSVCFIYFVTQRSVKAKRNNYWPHYASCLYA